MSEHVAITLRPSGGEKETVKAGRFDLADEERPLAQNQGAGYRAIYDFGQPERSVFVIGTGQSGTRSPRTTRTTPSPAATAMLTERARVRTTQWGRWCDAEVICVSPLMHSSHRGGEKERR